MLKAGSDTDAYITPTLTATSTFSATETITETVTETMTFTATRTPVSGAYILRLNCAGDVPFTDSSGRVWQTDKFYWPGSYGYFDTYYAYGNEEVYTGTDVQKIYYDTMEFPREMEYRFDVQPGAYSVKLFMAEYFHTSQGQRIMDVYIEGEKFLSDLDLYKVAGYLNAYEPSFDVVVTDGTLNIKFVPEKDWAMIAGIEIMGLQPVCSPTPTRTPAANRYEVRIDCAGSVNYTAIDGRIWEADRMYTAGGYGLFTSTSSVYYNGAIGKIEPTADDMLYASFRNGTVIEYRFDVPSGLYTIGLLWSELAYLNKGERIFDVYIEGEKVMGDVDMVYLAGYSNSYDRYFYDIAVTDGVLNVRLEAKKETAMLAGIEVLGQQEMPTETPTLTITETNTVTMTITPTWTITETMTGTPPTATMSPTITNTALPEIAEIIRFETVKEPIKRIGIDGAIITQRVKVIGSVSMENLDYWVLEYTEAGKEEWVEFARGMTIVEEGELGILDPTMMLNGIYQIRMAMFDKEGNYVKTVPQAAFIVEGNMKIGNFTLSFTDMSVPVAGITMDIVRTYDSRVKKKGDFGIGWTLDVKNIRLNKSCVIGDGWNIYFDPFFYSLGLLKIRGKRTHLVTITFPDGKVYRFEAKVEPYNKLTGLTGVFKIKYEQVGGKGAELKAKDTEEDVLAVGYCPGDFEWVRYDTGEKYNPKVFELKTMEGIRYEISEEKGLKSMTDLNGNKLIVDESGIHHTTGKSIVFERDEEGRITKITGPDGKSMTYTYNGSGDLVEFKDREQVLDSSKGKTEYEYDEKHNLISIKDPREKVPIRNEYDDNGRLIRHIDAYNNVIEYVHDIENNREVVINRVGKPTEYKYDDRGNVIEVKPPVGEITYYSYDEYDNKVMERIGESETRYEYASFVHIKFPFAS